MYLLSLGHSHKLQPHVSVAPRVTWTGATHQLKVNGRLREGKLAEIGHQETFSEKW